MPQGQVGGWEGGLRGVGILVACVLWHTFVLVC